MDDLRKMLDEFKNNYAYIYTRYAVGVREDNELIYRILNGMMDRIEDIERQNNRAEIVEDKKMTNGDWLRSQGDEEMAELIAQGEAYARALSVTEGDNKSAFIVKDAIIKWLEEEHEDD